MPGCPPPQPTEIRCDETITEDCGRRGAVKEPAGSFGAQASRGLRSPCSFFSDDPAAQQRRWQHAHINDFVCWLRPKHRRRWRREQPKTGVRGESGLRTHSSPSHR
jgi:hypothetical protein